VASQWLPSGFKGSNECFNTINLEGNQINV
jgi:hypothetical protein